MTIGNSIGDPTSAFNREGVAPVQPTMNMKMSRHFAILLALILGSVLASAQNFTNTASGYWSVSGKWTPATAPTAGGAAADIIVFNPTAADNSTNDLAGAFWLNQLQLVANQAVTLQSSNASSLLFTNNGAALPLITNAVANTLTINSAITLATNLTAGVANVSGCNIVINSNITESVTGTTLTMTGGGSTGGTLRLYGTNGYSGQTIINSSGSLYFTSLGTVGGGASSLGAPTTVTNGTINISGSPTLFYTGGATTTDRILNLISGATTFDPRSGSGLLTLNGNIIGGGLMILKISTNNCVVNGAISVSSGLYLTGGTIGGTATLNNPSNSFPVLSLNQGTLSVNTISNSSKVCAIGNGTSILFGQAATFGKLQFTGANGGACNRTLVIQAGTSYSGGGAIENTVAGQTLTMSGIVTNLAAATAPVLQLMGVGNGVMSGSISNVSGTALEIVKSGGGTWTLSGTNAYSGPTIVSNGVVLVNGNSSTVTNTWTVISGATLGGTGTIGGNVGFGSGAFALFTNGTTMTISGSLTLNNNTVELNLSNNVPTGVYTLATYNTTGSSGSFNATPTVLSGSFANPTTTTNYVTTTGGQLNLVVLNTYSVTYNANGLSGSVPTDSNAYTNGATVTVSGAGSLTIPAGYHFTGWTNSSGTSYSAGSTFAMPGNNVTLYAQISPNNYTLTYNAGAHGTISGTAAQTVAYLASGSAVTAVANAGYGFANWSDGVTTATRTDTALIGGTNVTANYTNNLYTLIYAAGAGGSIGGATLQTVSYLASGSAVTAVASNGYAFTSWSDGVTTSNRTDTALIGGTNVTASFVSTCTSPGIVGGIDPGSATLTAFSPLVLTLTNVTGSADLAYQWRSNSVAILNATNSSYTNLSVVVTDAGNYDCVVTNGCGSVTSSVVVVTINPATPIVQTATTAIAISYGQTLSNSTITVGSFTNLAGQAVAISSYGFVNSGIAPNAGTTNVAVYYLPTDSVNYVSVTNTLYVTVSPAALSITANNDSKFFGLTKTFGAGSTNFTSSGLQNGESIGTVTITATSSPTNGTAATDNVGSYVLTPSEATGGTFNSGNYATTYNTGTLSVIQASTFVGANSSKNPSGYKDTVSYNATLPTDATGSVVFSSTNGAFSTNAVSSGTASSLSITNLPRGTNLITVTYIGDGNYLGSTTNLEQIVTNHPPVANVMTVTRTAGLALIISLSDVATNWTDNPDGDHVSLTGVTMQSTNGVNLFPLNWTTNLDDSIVTTNAYAFIGYTNSPNVADQISYSISDGQGGTKIGFVNIVIQSSVTGTNSITGHDFTSPYSNTVTAYGIPYFYYILERSTNLTSPVWVDVSTNQAATNGVINAVDTFWDLGGVKPSPSAFYQLKWQP